ncbi:TIGR03560 family F420-dependent LLM class oxidoreductase [Amycolatopsis acidiphila]|uniref:TIGR03560 family F420-dependent LLM class oxidoreductase n=2 Tax=Amycolatopsis acidiphila TaxID=715473 RepID=A0A557ZU79_9PSEU|nr:TIGR03560 family F420-dependent LLM class oxidoreductase [Amycolatopsis acidiphila]UIJ64201.1 TIGR03560 family F420-dependent LLM class oxidoreductase [Amycolatopsis acidiphila]GHG93978.1 LLM class F420-dependent oxidoreductase [Amycolatopsis acidiphila]
MRFGIKTRPEHTTWPEMRDVWVAADDIELFESAWNWDHFYPLSGDLAGPNYEGWSMLAALAQATRRIRLGCQVSGMIYRHPAVLANMAATIDVIAEGRLDVGIGAGWNQQECDAYGIELPPLRERFDLFDEGVQVIVGLLSQETTDFDGKYFKLTDARCEPKGVQRPHPPIVIGGRGPRRTLRAVALWAQQWNAIVQSPADWKALKQTLLVRCDEVGRNPAEIVCSVNVVVDPETGIGPAAEKVAEYKEAGVDLIVLNLPHRAKPGILEPLAEALAPLA